MTTILYPFCTVNPKSCTSPPTEILAKFGWRLERCCPFELEFRVKFQSGEWKSAILNCKLRLEIDSVINFELIFALGVAIKTGQNKNNTIHESRIKILSGPVTCDLNHLFNDPSNGICLIIFCSICICESNHLWKTFRCQSFSFFLFFFSFFRSLKKKWSKKILRLRSIPRSF